ncbi:MAG: hypothetical protein BAJALOKI2v1_620004 [Promethearchaeota archaeon]|nr:MAG: hypothetical protein BAJALOKI2v1_620004 [Candidatus Lokiarchaeota archaeon]
MVADIWFFTVLGILIAFVAFFVIFMVWLKSQFPHPLMMKVLSTLHSALFGYESALVELIGSRGYKSHVFPKIVETMQNLEGEDELIDELFKAKTPKEAMEIWLEVLKLTGITKEGYIEEKGDDTYNIVIPDCSMCNPIHDMIGDQKGICPMALILASSIAITDAEIEPEMQYSEFSPTGTKTTLKLKKTA